MTSSDSYVVHTNGNNALPAVLNAIDQAKERVSLGAGCLLGWVNPVISYALAEANYRTHRKALVIDGRVAFVGGMGIGDHYWSSRQGGTTDMKLLFLLAIAAARHTIDIESPYLITDESSAWSLHEARQRGLRVRLLQLDSWRSRPVPNRGRDWLWSYFGEVF